MSAKAQVYILSIILSSLGIGLIFYKNLSLKVPLTPDHQKDVWVVEAVIQFKAQGDTAKVTFEIPGNLGNLEILNQHGSSNNFGFTINEVNGREKAIWAKRQAVGNERIYYQFSLYDTEEEHQFEMEVGDIEQPFFEEPYNTAIRALADTAWERSADPNTYAKELFNVLHLEGDSQNINLVKNFLNEAYTMKHLIRDMLKIKDIPAVVIRGLKLEDRARNKEAGYYLAVHVKSWQIIDIDTGKVTTPVNTIFWHPSPLLEVEGGINSTITFSMMKSRESAKALAVNKGIEESSLMAFSIYTLPIQYQTIFQMLLLIPMGTFVVVIMRNIVGMATSGTFMPVLLALAFIETTLGKGLIVLSIVLMMGLLVRFYLSRLNLLLVPRISSIVICVVLLMAFISIVGYKLGFEEGISVTLFPMIIISWTIERVSVLWEEQGGREVVKQMGGSLIVSILAYFVMTNALVKYFTFTFPECLLVLLALVLLMGTYSGYRFTELFRFEPLVKES
ncbi:MAG: inactive transglutaminase family protein [Lentisphaeraceae bacterium]|nr:inactive transglutaminase family protein [Lentisphaeraceae bacterium]